MTSRALSRPPRAARPSRSGARSGDRIRRPPRESARTRQLLAAIERGDVREVRAALRTGVDPNREIAGEMPFVRALTHRHHPECVADMVRALLEAGAVPHLPRGIAHDKRIQVRGVLKGILREAIRFDDLEGVQLALAAGANPNARDADGVSMLVWAVQGSLGLLPSVQVVRTLLAAGASPAPRGREMRSALGVAAGLQNAKAVAVLLEAGADVDDGGGHRHHMPTPLSAALCRGRVSASALRLIRAGASLDPTVVAWRTSYRTFRAVCAMVGRGEVAYERLIPLFSAADAILREGAFTAVGQRPD